MLFGQAGFACEPCPKYIDLQQSIDEAKLIVVGKRTTPLQPEETRQEGGPQYIDVKVDAVLKGQAVTDLKAVAWFDMCSYGIVVPPDKPYIMILDKAEEETFYRPLNNGCAASALAVEGNGVVTHDGLMPMETFKQSIK